MSATETQSKTLETITLVDPKDENTLLQIELRTEGGGYLVAARRGRRGEALEEDSRSDAPISLDNARTFFDRSVEEAMEQGFEPEYDDDLDDLDDLDLAALEGDNGRSPKDKVASLSGLAALAAALGELDGADPKAMLERLAPEDDADEEAGAAPVEFDPEQEEVDEGLPADARVSLDEVATLAADDDQAALGGVDPQRLLGALLSGGQAPEPPAPVKRPARAPAGASPEELCDLALARAVQRLVDADQIELDPRAFEPLLEELLKVVVAADSPQAALENACETLMDSDHVEEIYGEDALIVAELRRAFEEVRAEAQRR